VVMYVDGNDNGQLDTVSNTATSSPDTVIGFQQGYAEDDPAYYWIVYREGDLHPLYHRFSTSCEEPAQGYSVVEFRYGPISEEPQTFEGCFLKQGQVKMNIIVDANMRSFTQFACEDYYGLERAERAPATSPVPEGAATWCEHLFREAGEELLVKEHPERFCTGGNVKRYGLVDIVTHQWDDRATPPSWWPCEVSAPAP
jgi:hypothetical protein